MNKTIKNLDKIFEILKENYYKSSAPSVSLIAETTNNPFNILISTIISLRTKDQVTLQASKKLFKIVKSFKDLIKLSNNEIEKLIYPAGFYKTKAVRLKKIAEIIINQYKGIIPDTIEELLKLPGVGRKTANLVVSLGFDKPGLCVDTHVHRITNRLGWVKTKKPEETEFKLREILPLNYWRSINEYLVSFGQTICKPLSPFCSICGLSAYCPKINVIKAR